MREITYRDTVVFVLLVMFFTWKNHGFVAFIIFCSASIYFIVIVLPFEIYTRLYPFYIQSTYFQKATLYELVTSRWLRFNFKYFNPRTIGGEFMGDSVSKWFFYYRCYSQAFAKLNDSRFDYVKEEGIKGIWITSPSRAKYNYDIVLFYIHGGGFVQGSPWFYAEHMNITMITLQEQGFRNPAVFLVDYRSTRDDDDTQEGTFIEELSNLSEGWQYVQKKASRAHLVLTGDGSGGLLALALLFHLAYPYKHIPIPMDSSIKPSALVLISPWTKLLYEGKDMYCDDYMDQDTFRKLSRSYLGEEEYLKISRLFDQHRIGKVLKDGQFEIESYRNPSHPNSSKFWQEAFPKYGAIVMYGDEEFIRDDIEELANIMKSYGRVKSEALLNQIHDWPILTFYTERCEELREDGIQYMTGALSRMLIWNTDTFFNDGAIVPVNIEYS